MPPHAIVQGRILSFPAVMGVVNTTPDSFSDGGTLFTDARLNLDRAFDRCAEMVANGASIIDIGGESTRPGAVPISQQEELDRVIPLVERVSKQLDVALSIDTSSPNVMTEGAKAGAHIINDVRALQRPGAVEAAAATELSICLMHMQGEPTSMQQSPRYDSVTDEVVQFLQDRLAVCQAAGIPKNRLWIDPGFGFGKSLAHNTQLMRDLRRFIALSHPVLIGVSRKSMIGAITGREVNDRVPGGIAFATWALTQGVHVIRTHDVAETMDAVSVIKALREE